MLTETPNDVRIIPGNEISLLGFNFMAPNDRRCFRADKYDYRNVKSIKFVPIFFHGRLN